MTDRNNSRHNSSVLEPKGMYANFEDKIIGDLINPNNELLVGVFENNENTLLLPDLY